MCGIAGIVDFKNSPKKQAVLKMLKAINYRGPNSTGTYVEKNIAVGINRLSIIDLVTGDQPIFNETKSVAVVTNGEIYNFQTLKTELLRKGHIFKTKSDTEVLVHLYEQYGPDFVKKLSGMFAFALWDKKKQLLLLGRDPVGIKPLFFAKSSQGLIFSSELKSLLCSGLVSKKISKQGLEAYLALGFVPRDLSIIEGVHKLLPGHIIQFSKQSFKYNRYWDLKKRLSEKPNITKLANTLSESVNSQTMSDVPWGVFLSGGLDSSLIVHYLTQNKRKLKTFSIKFAHKTYNESTYAKIISKKYKTSHTEIPYTSKTLLSEFSEIMTRLDEPLADPSLFPTYHLAKVARKKITVALTGDGGDELFGGYPVFIGDTLASKFQLFPRRLTSQFKKFHFILPISFGAYSKTETLDLFFDSLSLPRIARRLEWTSRIGNVDMWNKVVNHSWLRPLKNLTFQALLFKTYLPDDLLVKSDRASMLNSLEARVPFLDTKLIDYAFSTGNHYGPLTLKKQLKQLSKQILPREIVTRKKRGFGLPLTTWSRGELKALMHLELSRPQILEHVPKEKIETLWLEHQQGQKDNARVLWMLTILSAWLKFLSPQPPTSSH